MERSNFLTVNRIFYGRPFASCPSSRSDNVAFMEELTHRRSVCGGDKAERLPENILFTASQLILAASSSSFESINQTTGISGEIFNNRTPRRLTFSYLHIFFSKSFADFHEKANWPLSIQRKHWKNFPCYAWKNDSFSSFGPTFPPIPP